MQYIQSPGPAEGYGDIFLDLPKEQNDVQNLILYRGTESFVILNAFPYTSGHLLIAPYRQVADLSLLTEAEMVEIQRLLGRSVGWLKACYQPDGFNIGLNLGKAAGAGIPIHLHWHIVPRWNGDTNFMTTVSDTRVLPESLQQTYARLKAVVEQDRPA